MRICLVLEGSYPYVHGGVSTWMHAYIQAMPRQKFSLWVIGAKAEDRGKFKGICARHRPCGQRIYGGGNQSRHL